jgi:sugar phosphate isomerase/epimerase
MKITRRDFSKLALAVPATAGFAARINSKIDGVMIGAQTYSFRDRPLDDCIAAMKQIGLGYAELTSSHLEPKDKEALKAWRADPPMDQIKAVRKKFDDAGIEIYAFNYSFRSDWSDREIANGFEIAKALGVNRITASGNVDGTARVDKYAQQYKVFVGFHNHDSMKKNEFSTPDDWKAALEGRSKYIGINLDIGHFTAANFDPVGFLEEHHERILTLHIKDRKRNHGDNVPFGQGDTNIKGVLQLLKTKQYRIPAMIEYEYGKPGMDTVAEVQRCFDYCKSVLS